MVMRLRPYMLMSTPPAPPPGLVSDEKNNTKPLKIAVPFWEHNYLELEGFVPKTGLQFSKGLKACIPGFVWHIACVRFEAL